MNTDNTTDEKVAQKVALIILDGWGHREEIAHNAVHTAQTPNFDALWNTFPHTLLEASGEAVGLPEGQMGNSEIGHMTIGAGRTLDTDLVRIKKAITNGEFHTNTVFQTLFSHVKIHKSVLHVMGLFSSGGVHSHKDHFVEFARAAKAEGVEHVAFHLFLDGRDTPQKVADKDILELEERLLQIGVGYIASLSGRYFAMDRDSNWDRLEKTEKALYSCEGNTCELRPSMYLKNAYDTGLESDEFLEPATVLLPEGYRGNIADHDAVFCVNFRADRMRMVVQNLLKKKIELNLQIATMTEYHSEYDVLVAFPPESLEATLASAVSDAGKTQMHIAETEKYPHTTFFLNGGKNDPYDGEVHELILSRKDVPTHDHAPEMRAREITDKAIEYVNTDTDFIFINYANPDIVGHTANVPAIVKALETVDAEMKRFVDAFVAAGGICIITADHGNAEQNFDADAGVPHTSHTLNKVPCIFVSQNADEYSVQKHDGTLADLAPTVLFLLEIEVPKSMTGDRLV